MLRIRELTTEYQDNPIGMDTLKPRFSWIMESDQKDVRQESYRVTVQDEASVVWDSGFVADSQSLLVEYEGDDLKPSTNYQVRVEVCDNYQNTAQAKGRFMTGLMDGSRIKGEWITCRLDEQEGNTEDIIPVFGKQFRLKGNVKQVVVYATALGIYELEVNGNKAGETCFAPGWTSYQHRIQYQTYDITPYLKKDENLLEITVSNGWYKGILGFTGEKNCHFGDTLAALAQVRITYDNGCIENFGTDDSWYFREGIIRSSEIYMGEVIDCTFEDKVEKPVSIYAYTKDTLVAQESEPVKIIRRIKPVQKIITPKGEVVLDFGQNLVGVIECRLKQKQGTCVRIRHAEVLDKEGNFYTENLRKAKSEDLLICSGNEDLFRPRFTFHGFRYISLEGLDENWQTDDFTACVMHTDMKETGSFCCSHAGVSRLVQNIQWGQRGNFLDIPTDCPQRDERLGWTGDAQIFARTAAYQFHTARFFSKWLHDLKAEQNDLYGVPHVIPNILDNQDGAAAWSDAAVIIPWTMYQVYGDTRILEEQFDSMKGWVDYISRQSGANGLWQQGYQYGDWVALDKEEGADRTGATDVYFIANAYYAYSTELLIKAAKVLGYDTIAKDYQKLYENILQALREEYVTKTGRLVSETQTGCVLALHFNLVEEKHRERILQTLLTNLQKHNNHLVTGFVGTPYLCHTLSDNGAHEIAGKVFLKEDYPSWLYAVNMGATTIWERWNSMNPDGSFDESGMNSFNHYAYGAIGDWIYQKLGGLQILESGYKKTRIAPQLIKGITWAEAELETGYGTLACRWKCQDKKIFVDIQIPVNTTAVVVLPEREELQLGSGCYSFEYETELVLEQARFTEESTLAQILAQPQAVEMLEQMSPGMTQNEMLKFVYDKSVSELYAMMPPEGRQMFEIVLQALNEGDAGKGD